MSNLQKWMVTKNNDDKALFTAANWQDCLAKIVKRFNFKKFGLEQNEYKCFEVYHDSDTYYIRFNYEKQTPILE